MRKTILDVLGIVVAISMCTATPVATASVNVNNYVDTNEYGICDNIADGNGCNYVDVNKDGVCDNIANGNGNCGVCGANFVDANGDGICDNCVTYNCNGNGTNFVDDNNNGVCDNYENNNGNCYGNGYGCNSQGGHHNKGGHGRCGR